MSVQWESINKIFPFIKQAEKIARRKWTVAGYNSINSKKKKREANHGWIKVHVAVYFNTNSSSEKRFAAISSPRILLDAVNSMCKREDLTLGCCGMFGAIRFEHESKWGGEWKKKRALNNERRIKEKATKQSRRRSRFYKTSHHVRCSFESCAIVVFCRCSTAMWQYKEIKKKKESQLTPSECIVSQLWIARVKNSTEN